MQAFSHWKCSSFWVSPLPKSGSFCVSRVLNSAQFADLGRGDTQNYMDLGSGTRKMICIKNDNMNLCFVWKPPKISWKYVFYTWFECQKTWTPPSKEFQEVIRWQGGPKSSKKKPMCSLDHDDNNLGNILFILNIFSVCSVWSL